MLRLLILVLVLGLLAPLVIARIGPGNPLDVEVEGRQVLVRSDGLEARLDLTVPVDDTYMLFGGIVMDGMRGAIHTGAVAGLAVRHAELIAQRWPDFTKCSSPGAKNAQRLAENFSMIAADGAARDTIAEAITLHEAAIASGGERICLSVRGTGLSLDRITAPEAGQDLTADFGAKLRGQTMVFVREASLAECRTLF